MLMHNLFLINRKTKIGETNKDKQLLFYCGRNEQYYWAASVEHITIDLWYQEIPQKVLLIFETTFHNNLMQGFQEYVVNLNPMMIF